MGQGSTELRELGVNVVGLHDDVVILRGEHNGTRGRLRDLEKTVEQLIAQVRDLRNRVDALEAERSEGPSETKKRVSKTRRVAAAKSGKAAVRGGG